MAKIIIIRGKQNTGKTTTSGLVYKELLKLSDKNHTFNNKEAIQDSLIYDKEGNTIDFTAILNCKNKKIGFASAGDVANDLHISIKILIALNVDIIICCARSRNVKGSAYRMIFDDFSSKNDIISNIFTAFSNNIENKINAKSEVVNKIIDTILIAD